MLRSIRFVSIVVLVSMINTGCARIRGVMALGSKLETTVADLIDNCDSVTMQGDGTSTTPFIICSQAQFQLLNTSTPGQYYSIGRDITFDASATPISILFRANLEGNHHTLSSFQNVGTTGNGLFTRLHTGAVVQNLTLSNFKVSSGNGNWAGALAGRANTATITNVIVKDSIVSGGKMVGGLIGFDHSSTLTGVEVHHTAVVGQQDTGLLMGKCDGTTSLEKTIVEGQVSGALNIGGMIGNATGVTVNQTAIFASITDAQDDNYEWNIPISYSSSANFGGFFGYVENGNITDSYFLGKITDSVDGLQAGMGTMNIGSFAGESLNTSVNSSYFAANSIIDAIGNSSNVNGFIGQDDGGSNGWGLYHAHSNVPALEAWWIWGYDDISLMDQNNYGFDFSDLISDPDHPYVGIWQMSTAARFQFASLSFQSQTAPFGDVEYNTTPVGALYITETAAANGYTFAEIPKGTTDYTLLTLHNSTGLPINLNSFATGGIRNAFHVVSSGVHAGTCSSLTTLTDGSTCTIGIEYAPITAQSLHETNRDALLIHYTIDGVATTYLYPLEGQTIKLDPVFSANPALAFGNLIFPGTPSLPLNIDNTGVNAGTILSIAFSDPAYSFTPITCNVGTTLNNGDWCNMTITFTPTTIRNYAANLIVTYEDAAHAQYTLTFPITGALIEHPFNDDPAMACQTADGSVAHPFCVYDRVELETVPSYSSFNFIQTANIDLGGASSPMTTLLGLSGTGVYNGQNHTISNLYSEKNGLFVVLDTGAVLKNLILDSPVVKRQDSNDFVGAAVGYNSGGTIDHVSIIGNGSVSFNNARPYVDQKPTGGLVGWSINGTISNCDVQLASVSGEEAVGGLVGYLQGGSVTNSTANVTMVTGSGRFVGGFAGVIGWSASVSNSSSSSAVTTTKTHITQGGFTSSYYSGGFVGYVGANCSISNSYSTGDLISADGEAGGFAGRLDTATSVSTCYSSGNVTAAQNSVGGFAGKIAGSGTVTNAFSTGLATGITNIGGFAGWNEGNIYKSMALVGSTSVVSGTGNSVGGFVGISSGTIRDSFTAFLNVSASGSGAGGFVGSNSGTIQRSYTLTNAVSGGSNFNPFAGSNSGTITDAYFNADIGTGDTTSTGITSANMTNSANFVNFDFTTPVFKMPTANAGASVLSPVPAWACNLAGTGITCP